MNAVYSIRMQAELIVHIPVRLRNFNIKESSSFGNDNQLLFFTNVFALCTHMLWQL
jgi:hypothetical protein